MKFCVCLLGGDGYESHPARGAWIEIEAQNGKIKNFWVAPRKGCVD